MTKIQKSIADIAALGNSPIDDGMRERVLKAVNDAIGDEDSRTLTPRMRKTLDILLVALGEAFGKHPSAAQLFEEAVTIAKIKLSKCDASTAGEQTLIKGN